MNFSQMKDERLLLFYENVRQQVALDGKSRLLARASKHTLTSFATKWTGGGLGSRRLIGQRRLLIIEIKLDTPVQVREFSIQLQNQLPLTQPTQLPCSCVNGCCIPRAGLR
jgi:hypothetical protein